MFSPHRTPPSVQDRGPRAGVRRAERAYAERARSLHQTLSEEILAAGGSGEHVAERLWQQGCVLATYLLPGQPLEQAALAATIQRRAAQQIRSRNLDHRDVERRRRAYAHFAEQLALRAWQPQDAERYRALMDDQKLWRYLPETRPQPFTTRLAEQLIELGNELPEQQLVWAVERGGEAIGQFRVEWATAAPYREAEVSYWLGRSAWGQGHASAVVTHGCRQLFSAHGDLDYLFARVMVGNDASAAVLRNAGFRFEGMERPRQDRWASQRVRRYGLYRTSYAPDLASAS